jgi:hypothetical protein
MYRRDPVLTKVFAADFVLQGDTPGKIFGSVRYNSDVQLVKNLR